jgi:hypothetical protein
VPLNESGAYGRCVIGVHRVLGDFTFLLGLIAFAFLHFRRGLWDDLETDHGSRLEMEAHSEFNVCDEEFTNRCHQIHGCS